MLCGTRVITASVVARACLALMAGLAQAQVVGPEEPLLTVDQVRDAFVTAGYQVDHVDYWNWTSPPTTSVQVHDPASGRALIALVYAGATGAYAARMVAETHERALNLRKTMSSTGPHLVLGYGLGIWSHNVAMVQTTRPALSQLDQMQLDNDCGAGVDADALLSRQWPDTAVDGDFLHASDGVV